MSDKYANGMYKNTSNAQDETILKVFENCALPKSMSENFDNFSGNICVIDNTALRSVIINRKGFILYRSDIEFCADLSPISPIYRG